LPRRSVLVDTNILVSGLVFIKGNEHRILQLAEDEKITLIIPEIVIVETEKVLQEKFAGFERLLDIFLRRLEFESVPTEQAARAGEEFLSLLSDAKDTPIYAAIVVAKPDYAITGDKRLRNDLKKSSGVTRQTRVLSSAEFLQEFLK
jgi:putative PIN family toxin of toxin-antitoxin system